MFVDIRGSTELAAARLPYDSVFILGRFVAAVSTAVVEAGGMPNQFLGNGVPALFGLQADAATACRKAMQAVSLVAAIIHMRSEVLAPELMAPIRFGIGLHCGRSVLGEIGFRDHVTFTALGDAANVASRLEGLCKELDCEAVVSEEVLRRANYDFETLPAHQARLRGRAEPVAVRLFRRIGDDRAPHPGTGLPAIRGSSA